MLSAGDTPSLTHYLFCTHVCSLPKIVIILTQISDFVNQEKAPDESYLIFLNICMLFHL